jgi:3-isopropylmalate/(R)-2-methylmalate dehydratase large subunit
MMAEMDAKCAIIAADEKTADYLGLPLDRVILDRADPDAVYEKVYEVKADEIVPLVACPHRVNHVKPVREVEGVPVHQAFLGSCTNGRIEDFEQALEILRGRQVHPHVRLIVVPASQAVMLEATKRGFIEELLLAGAAIMTSSCASCAGAGPGLVGAGERCISTTNRNFKGRMGSEDSEVFLSSAYVVAAAAVTGELTDPRRLL